VTDREPFQLCAVNLPAWGRSNATGRPRRKSRSPQAAHQERPLPKDRTRPHVRDDFSVDNHVQDSVEQDEQFVPGTPLLAQHLSLGDRSSSPMTSDKVRPSTRRITSSGAPEGLGKMS
jgi:hypothetical protein